MTDNWRLDSAVTALERLHGFYPRVDAKFSVVLGIDLAMLASLAGAATRIQDWAVPAVPASVAFIFLCLSLWQVYCGAFPHLEGPDESLIYFRPIARKSESEYVDAFKVQTMDSHIDDVLRQCHRNAEILTAKFDRLKIAFQALVVAILPWAFLLTWAAIATLPVGRGPS